MKRIFEIHFSAQDMNNITANEINKVLDKHIDRGNWLEVYDITKNFKLIEKEDIL